jgi:hypothetical protein
MRHESFPAIPDHGRAAAPRAELTLLCEVRQGSGAWRLARLTDLSHTGFKLAWRADYDTATPLRIRIPGMQALAARICWHKEREIGCEFVSPLHIAVFEHIVRIAGGTPA